MSLKVPLIFSAHSTVQFNLNRFAIKAVPKTLATITLMVALALNTSLLVGCTTASDQLSTKLKLNEPVSRSYITSLGALETAIGQSLVKYPLRIHNLEAGVIETDFVTGKNRFQPAHQPSSFSSGYRYRLIVHIVKGTLDEQAAYNVQIVKKIEILRDFFSDPEPIPSDGLEEQALLYRIERELAIRDLVKKSLDWKNQKALKEFKDQN